MMRAESRAEFVWDRATFCCVAGSRSSSTVSARRLALPGGRLCRTHGANSLPRCARHPSRRDMPGKLRIDGFRMTWAGIIAALGFELLHAANFSLRTWPLALGQRIHAFALGVLHACWPEKSQSIVASVIGHSVGNAVVCVIAMIWPASSSSKPQEFIAAAAAASASGEAARPQRHGALPAPRAVRRATV